MLTGQVEGEKTKKHKEKVDKDAPVSLHACMTVAERQVNEEAQEAR